MDNRPSTQAIQLPPYREHKGNFILTRSGDNAFVNMRQSVVHHSPCGFEWGYGGSGPADLALNILEAVLTDEGYSGPRDRCFDGSCFRIAWDLHQHFKWEVVAPMAHTGGIIGYDFVVLWLKSKAGDNYEYEY